ncbi:tetratricopeptide repeat protein 27-like, partial [Uranotaenia lowii]|uniref:tetratricopeptide repeat protein 27-like n=1 Tax=Uranotaenia lowii TaxID=190385 RepID=UPI00247927F1
MARIQMLNFCNKSQSEESLKNSELHVLINNCSWKECFESEGFRFNPDKLSETDREDLLKAAIIALGAFIQNNFLGPKQTCEKAITIVEGIDYRDKLRSDGEELNVNVFSPELLYMCKIIFDGLVLADNEIELEFDEAVWYLRFLVTYQRCLDDLTHSLYVKFDRLVNFLESRFDSLDNMNWKIQTHLEILQGYILFKRVSKSARWMTRLEELSGIKISIEGVLGVRTKYQQNPLPQLTLRTEGSDALGLPSSKETHGHVSLPTVLKLDDDLRLEKVQFVVEHENDSVQLPSLIQQIVLTKVLYLKVSQPKDTLADEELKPYLTSLLYQSHGPWSTRVAALFMNIEQEANHKRTVDRSLKQCEELVSLLESAQPTPMADRFSLAFCSALIPRWLIKARLGDLMISLGLIKSALDLFLELQLWENVIACYNHLELRHKSAEIIRQEIDKKPTVTLFCLLGDATDDIECYRKAWELSNESSARAQRHWGNYYFARKQYSEAIVHLNKSID